MGGSLTVLAFGNRLSSTAWAREVAKIDPRPQHSPCAPEEGTPESIEIDLSGTRSVDFLILGRLLVLLQVFAAKRSEIIIRMPSKDLLDAERSYLQASKSTNTEEALRQISRHQRQRINCRLFIKQSGFDSMLRLGPLKHSRIELIEENVGVARQDTKGSAGIEPDQYDIPGPPRRQRGIIPYRWINAHDFAAESKITDPVFRSIKALGIAADDATALTRGVLDELIENAKHHGRPERDSEIWAVVGGELAHPQSYVGRINDFDPALRDFVIWSSKEPSPLLRLFIGDAGKGIPASVETRTVGKAASDNTINPTPPDHGAKILAAVDSHAKFPSRDREPQGLWKVQRVVRSFQGALLITSGMATAGYIFDATPEGHQVNIASPAWLPGTMVECTVLTAPGRDISLHQDELSSPDTSSSSISSDLTCTTAFLKPRVGFDSDDLAIIEHHLDRLKNVPDGGLVIGVEVPAEVGSPAGSEIEDAITSILDIASKAANPTTVTLVFSGVARKLLSVAIDALNRRQDENILRLPRLHSPILVLSPENVHYWAGGTPLVRQLLSILSQSAKSDFKILDIGQSLAVEAPSALEREIRDQPRLLQLDRGIISLKLRPRDAVTALTRFLGIKLTSAVSTAMAPGVSKGRFLIQA